MEKYIGVILLLTPGFIAQYTASYLGGRPAKRGEVDTVLIYFGYSLAAFLVTLSIAALCGLFSFAQSWHMLEINMNMPIFVFKFLALQIVCSIGVGAVWELYVRKRILNLFNMITTKRGGNKSIVAGSLFHELFNDGKDHFLLIEKGEKEVAVGFFNGVSSPSTERKELHLNTGLVYSGWFQYAKEHPEHPLHSPIGVYFDLDSDLVIKEYAYPDDWVVPTSESLAQASAVEAVEMGEQNPHLS